MPDIIFIRQNSNQVVPLFSLKVDEGIEKTPSNHLCRVYLI
ncbi:hypothetical protein SBF1_200007 [Candidatus Desulfosporosinus infrequens]|uniref:Uncharacterized protein n=1 Tax=Candidatus Desulfosporosinus infrequens TaxID=2043169 RepID=A0A2U3KH61_9FIRM|nr:hypothetical protein SBF1_200007 [Candidatus Desulfosporosinus infrequens]